MAGATGALGRLIVERVRSVGHEAVLISRSEGVDLLSGDGLVEKLEGVSAVIDASARMSTSASASVAFFSQVTRNLLAAERRAGVPHHVAVSIIGAGAVDASYYAGKAAQERILVAEAEGWSLLRTTQFFEFARQLVDQGRLGPVQVVPVMRSRPVAAREVAEELVDIARGRPRGLAPDLAGPGEVRMAALVRAYLAATGRTRPVLEVPVPGRWGRGMRDGSLLPRPGTRTGRQGVAQWLAEQSG